MTMFLHPSARVQQAAVADPLLRLCQRVQEKHALLLNPLRLVVVTAELGETVSYWQRALGLPEAGVSKQPEGVVAGKYISWGSDQESARSIIILDVGIAAGVAAGEPLAVATVVHELGHVHDDFARSLVQGFTRPKTPPQLNDWPRIRACCAENAWSEYAAESLAAEYLTPENLRAYTGNDSAYIEGVHRRLRQLVSNFKAGKLDLSSLWCRSVTDVSDVLANLGRAAARLPFVDDKEIRATPVNPHGEASPWKPVIERLVNELQALDAGTYSQFRGEAFSAIEETVESGFHAAGIFPDYGCENLRVVVR